MSPARLFGLAGPALLLGLALAAAPAAGQSNNGVYGGYVASTDWFRAMRQSAANQAMLRSLQRGASARRGEVPPDYVEVAGVIRFAEGRNPFPDGRFPDLRIASLDSQADAVERAPQVGEDGAFYTILKRGVSYEMSWMYYFGGREAWARMDVPAQTAAQETVELLYPPAPPVVPAGGAPGASSEAPAGGEPLVPAAGEPPAPTAAIPPAPGAGGGPPVAGAAPDASYRYASVGEEGLPSGECGELPVGEPRRSRMAAAGASFTYHTYTVTVPPGLSHLSVGVQGGGNNLDLAVKAGAPIETYDEGGCDFRDFSENPDPGYTVYNPQPGVLYVDVVSLNPFAVDYTVRAVAAADRQGGAAKGRGIPAAARRPAPPPNADTFDTSGLPDPPESFRDQLLWEKIRTATNAALKAEAHAALADYYRSRGDAGRAAQEARKADYWRSAGR